MPNYSQNFTETRLHVFSKTIQHAVLRIRY